MGPLVPPCTALGNKSRVRAVTRHWHRVGGAGKDALGGQKPLPLPGHTALGRRQGQEWPALLWSPPTPPGDWSLNEPISWVVT